MSRNSTAAGTSGTPNTDDRRHPTLCTATQAGDHSRDLNWLRRAGPPTCVPWVAVSQGAAACRPARLSPGATKRQTAVMTDRDTPLLTFLPGLLDLDDSHSGYPVGALELADALRGAGADVRFESDEVVEISLRAGDWWLPIIELGPEVAVNAAGGLLAAAIAGVLKRRRRPQDTVVRAKLTRRDSSGSIALLDMEGPAEAVVQALRELDDQS